MIGSAPIHPQKITAPGAVRFYTYVNLHVLGQKKLAACIGILRPYVVMDRKLQNGPGFEAFCYHEGTHAYEHHKLTSLLALLPGLIGAGVGIAFAWPLGFLGVPFSVAAWILWQRQSEVRADAVALYGAGDKEFYSMLQVVGSPSSRWGAWCYGRTIEDRWKRARRRCMKHGWR